MKKKDVSITKENAINQPLAASSGINADCATMKISKGSAKSTKWTDIMSNKSSATSAKLYSPHLSYVSIPNAKFSSLNIIVIFVFSLLMIPSKKFIIVLIANCVGLVIFLLNLFIYYIYIQYDIFINSNILLFLLYYILIFKSSSLYMYF